VQIRDGRSEADLDGDLRGRKCSAKTISRRVISKLVSKTPSASMLNERVVLLALEPIGFSSSNNYMMMGKDNR
jgi:hypothetical protein